MKIKYISPITDEDFEKKSIAEAQGFASSKVQIDVERVPYGTESIECSFDEALAAPGIIKVGLDAAKQGYDGIFVSCMGDPGLDALRELVDIPVVGPCRTSMLCAADLSTRFSVITVTDGVVPIIERIAYDAGVAAKLASVKAVNIPVLELGEKDRLIQSLFKLAIEAVEKYNAQLLILGCTGMIGVSEKLMGLLHDKRYDVPVIYPVSVSVRYLESLVLLGLSHSRMSYPRSPKKSRSIWNILNK
ncbi:Hydantoin racemase [Clostridiaceae bacterium BL-3]|nr:Hydantoin racemase [Clostridiaceae bacterium BL-3]